MENSNDYTKKQLIKDVVFVISLFCFIYLLLIIGG